MRDLLRLRLVLSLFLIVLAALVIASCGGGDDGGDSDDPASVAPAETPLYIGFTIRPKGEMKANIETLAGKIAGIDDLGALILEELEESAAEEGEDVDYETEIEPWLGEEGGFIYPEFQGGDFEGFALAMQTTDPGATEEFIEKQTETSEEEIRSDSFEGIDFKVDEDGEAVGVIGNLVVIAEEAAIFKEVAIASNGDSLADESTYSDAVSAIPDGSAADVYVDIGGLLREAESEDEVDEDAKAFFENAGIALKEATAVASLIPGSDRIEVDISSNAAKEEPPSGDASELLGSLPGDSVAALAAPDLGKRLDEGIDQIDEEGIPGEVPPNQLKKTLEEAGIDLEAIAGSIGDAGAFVQGTGKGNLGGALVLSTESESQAENTVSNIGLFLRSADVPGVTAIGGNMTGFSIRSPDLGPQPLVIAAKDDRIVIGYGFAAARAGLTSAGQTLADLPAYEEALGALGNTPIAAFVDGPAALTLVSSLIPASDEGFAEAKPYLRNIDYLVLGSEASGDLLTAKLIVGIGG
jgi:hypothetical protein